mgnify:CR=1 FL=1|tara:strand:- start:14332 stop:14658 length:327 start_codon:yes stop_codon:yes gene_type:complete
MSKEKTINNIKNNNNRSSLKGEDAQQADEGAPAQQATAQDEPAQPTGYIAWSEVMMDIHESGQYPFKELIVITNTRQAILLSLMLGNSNGLTYQAGAKLLSIHQTLNK